MNKTAILLLQNKAIINNVNQYGRTPLMVASRFNSTKVIEYLLKKGAKIEKTDKNSLTPLLVIQADFFSSIANVLYCM